MRRRRTVGVMMGSIDQGRYGLYRGWWVEHRQVTAYRGITKVSPSWREAVTRSCLGMTRRSATCRPDRGSRGRPVQMTRDRHLRKVLMRLRLCPSSSSSLVSARTCKPPTRMAHPQRTPGDASQRLHRRPRGSVDRSRCVESSPCSNSADDRSGPPKPICFASSYPIPF